METKNEIMTFENKEFGIIRAISMNGEPWFIGKDLTDRLGYSNSRDALKRHVDKADKNTVVIHDGITGNPNKTVVNESGMYALIFSSQLPSAKKFTHWVTSEVLPSIRKHGMYVTKEMLANMDTMMATIEELKAEVAALSAKPSSSYAEYVKLFPENVPIASIAADYGWSARKLNSFLKDKGIQYKSEKDKVWRITDEYKDRNLAVTEVFTCPSYTSTNTKWTPAGRMFIYDLMCEAGFEPRVGR